MACLSAREAGRRRFVREQRRAAIARVKAYRRWLDAGSPLRSIPEIPSDHDYEVARGAGVRC